MQLKLTDFTDLYEIRNETENRRCKLLLDEIKEYHARLLEELERAYEVAKKARAKGLDPSTEVEIPIARNMAERVEQLMKIDGLAKRILELEKEGLSREEICFKIAEEIVKGKFGQFDRLTSIDKAVRTAVAILTEGVVAAPIEGIAKVKIDKNHDGSEFLKIYYAGPIRSAGGTAQVISVLVGDYVRRLLGLNRYIPTEEEILRYCEEIPLYKKVANLQYLPSDAEIRLIVSNCPVCIDGEPTEDVEVSGYRDLPRVETNRVRGGMCLVIAEGIALKAPKLKKMVDKLGIDGWEWLDKLINKEFEEKSEEVEKFTSGLYEAKGEEGEEESELEIAEKLDKEKDEELEAQIKPKDKYLSDIVAGRPVFSHPSRKGGFRLRYGRARNSGYATVGINPATMIIADGFIAIGTQLKVERPGKAGGVVPVTSIEGPTVRLKNGDVVKINTIQEALALKDQVEKILDMGEILINYGDFLENNHPLMPSSYVYEWWIQEVEGKIPKGDYRRIDEDTALKLCDEYGVPLHPDHTYLWHDISVDDYFYLRNYVAEHGKVEGRGKPCLVIDYDERAKRILEDLLVEHKVRDGKIVLDRWKVLVRCLGLTYELKPVRIEVGDEKDVLKIVRRLSGLDVRAKAPTRIGARMGRPEKSKERRMSPPPHILFPLGLAGGNQRNIKAAINYTESYNSVKGEIEVEIALRRCKECGKETFWLKCDCGGLTEQLYYCPRCRIKIGSEICPKCGEEAKGYVKRKINIRELYEKALKNLNEWDSFETIKGVIGLTSKLKMPERLEKGILRAKHGVFVFKDGTIRYDMTDLPITHFKPKEINVSVEKLRELGYKYDWQGNELKSEDQIVELKPQDVILSKDCAEYLVKVAKFIDDLLVKFYGLEPFYNVEKPEDLIGHLVIGLAPHTSAGVLGRIIGFTDVLAGYAHPYFHAAKRRNCFTEDTEILVNIDGEVRRITMKDLYELFENERFERGVWVRDKPKTNVKVYSFDPESGKVVLTDVVDVIKAPSPEHLIEIELEGGRSFTVTPDHWVLVYDGKLVRKRAFEVKEGDLMLSPAIDFEEYDVEEIDLLKEFAKKDRICKRDLKKTEFGWLLRVKGVRYVKASKPFVYCLNARRYHNVIINDYILSAQCDGDEDSVMLLLDGLLNFSRYFLPDKRGGQMDAPLVLTAIIDPKEVDSEVHNMDIVERYPLDFYKATLRYADPKELVGIIERVEDRLESELRYCCLGFTHDTESIALGVKESKYKSLETMKDKLMAQMSLAEKIVAVDEHDVAERVLTCHFLPDIIGNLRAFTRQEFRCLNCNAKYRRLPLSGKCLKCGGKLTLTVHNSSITKYLDLSKFLCEKYEVSNYTKQRLMLIDLEIRSLFESDTRKQIRISDFFS